MKILMFFNYFTSLYLSSGTPVINEEFGWISRLVTVANESLFANSWPSKLESLVGFN